jgi:BASS family bile acid:Na+ symporter
MDGRSNWACCLGGFLHRHFLWLLLAAYALAAVQPWLGSAARNITLLRLVVFHETFSLSLPMLLLALLLFNAGLGAAVSELSHVARKPLVVLAGLAVNLLVPVGFLFLLFQALRPWHNPDETQNLLVGLAVVAAMPVAGSSTAWSQNANGNMALSLGLVVLSTLLSPLTTPLTLRACESWATGEYAEALRSLGGHGTGTFLLVCVVVPSLAGLLTRHFLGRQRIARLQPGVKLVNSVVLLFLCYANASASLPQVVTQPDWDYLVIILLAVVGLCLSAFAGGWCLARLLKVDEPQRWSLLFGLGMNNNGTGLVLASASLAALPWAVLPVLAYNLVQHLVAGGVSWFLVRARPSRSA